MDSGAAGHVMPGTIFPRVKLERKTTPKKFVAANGEQIKDLGERYIPFRTNEGNQRCMSRKIVVLDDKESVHSNQLRRNSDQAGREQRCVHNGHVDLS